MSRLLGHGAEARAGEDFPERVGVDALHFEVREAVLADEEVDERLNGVVGNGVDDRGRALHERLVDGRPEVGPTLILRAFDAGT